MDEQKAMDNYKKLMRQRREASTRHYHKTWNPDTSKMNPIELRVFLGKKKARSNKQLAYYYNKKAQSLSS